MDIQETNNDSVTTGENKSDARKLPFTIRYFGRIGLVLDESGFTLCICEYLFNKTVIHDIQKYDFESEIVNNPTEHIDVIIGEIQKYCAKNKTGNIPVNIGLLRHDVAFRRMFLPKMPAAELKQAVMWEGEKLFPFPFSESIVHYETVDSARRGDTPYLGINIVAAKSFIIEELFSKFSSAKIKIGQVNFLPSMLSNVVSKNDIKKLGERQILLHLDSAKSMALFVQNGHLEFFQEFVTVPFFDENSEGGISNFEAITAELQSFQDLYIAQSRTSEIGRIVISGPLAECEKLQSQIHSITGIPCIGITELDGYNNLTKNKKKSFGSENIPAIMAACASPQKHPLAPSAILRKIEQNKFTRRISAVAAIAILTAVSVHLLNLHAEKHLQSEIQYKQAEVHAFETSKAYQDYLNLAGKLNRGKSYLRLVDTRQDSHFNIILKSLSRDLPEELNLTSINFSNKDEGLRLRIMGHVKIGDFSPEIILAQYVESLRKLPFLQNVTVTNHHKQRKNNKFDLNFQIHMDTQV